MAAALSQHPATVDAIGIDRLGPRIRVPREVVDAHETVFSGELVEVMAEFFDEKRAAGFVRRAGETAIGKTPFRDPARLTLR